MLTECLFQGLPTARSVIKQQPILSTVMVKPSRVIGFRLLETLSYDISRAINPPDSRRELVAVGHRCPVRPDLCPKTRPAKTFTPATQFHTPSQPHAAPNSFQLHSSPPRRWSSSLSAFGTTTYAKIPAPPRLFPRFLLAKNSPVESFPMTSQQSSWVLCLETSSMVYSLGAMVAAVVGWFASLSLSFSGALGFGWWVACV